MKDDTRKLLRTGFCILLVGIASALLMLTFFGGITKQGPHTNPGWLSLMLAMGCLPTGLLMLMLGFAKLFSSSRSSRLAATRVDKK